MATPNELGYRMPAEWEPHAATWLSWPHNQSSWPGKLGAAVTVFARMAAALSRSETVHINVNGIEMEREARQHLRRAGAGGDVVFHHFPTNDAWCRDHGAVFVLRDAGGDEREVAAVDWGYNAWGGKYPPFDLDNAIARQMAEYLGVPRFDGGMILEGGSIDVNGQGLLLTTRSCLLNPNRNPHLTQEAIEQRLMDFLGVRRVLWLGDGIVGDDTDGHIDDLARFVAPNVVVTVVETDESDENYPALAENLARLKRMRNLDGRPLEVVELPMPPPLFWQGQRLPASYANFYIANGILLMPAFSAATDQQAAEILKGLFPMREIVTLDCSDLVWGLGAFHCLTQQVPANGSPKCR